MDMEQFIEEDIRAFLESRKATTPAAHEPPRQDGVLAPEELSLYASSRDYAKDLDEALAQKDIAKAKRVLLSLKESYNQYPTDAPEREEQQQLLEALYEHFQTTIAADRILREEAADERISHSLSTSPRNAVKGAAQPGGTRTDDTGTPPATPRTGSPRPPGLSPEQERALLADIVRLETLLKEGAVGAAIREYQRILRSLSPEQLTPDQRAAMMPRLHAVYETIAQRLATTGQPDASTRPNAARTPPTPPLPAPSAPPPPPANNAQAPAPVTDPTRRFAEHAAAAERAATAQDAADAMRQYRELRALYDGLPPAQQGNAAATLKALHGRISALLTQQTTERSASGPREMLLDKEERRLVGKP